MLRDRTATTMSSAQLPGALEQAQLTFDALRAPEIWNPRRRLYGRRHLRLRWTYEALWPSSSAWSALATFAMVANSEIADVASRVPLGGLRHYGRNLLEVLSFREPAGFRCHTAPVIGSHGARFFDDNAWVGLALMRQHGSTQDAIAQRILNFDLSGWSTDESWSHPGGIRWAQPNKFPTRNTCSNGPVAELAVLVHERTGDQATLDWAQRIYQWVRSTLIGADNLYRDHISPNGSIDTTIWSYNQGTMIGAGALLHRATGDQNYLDQAESTAAASVAHFTLDRLIAQTPEFNAVWFRNLLLLSPTDAGYLVVLSEYGNHQWSTARDASSGLFPSESSVLNSSSAMLELYSLLAGAEARP
jgi:predicted alpha-1,6-mannanase (GH76 family)